MRRNERRREEAEEGKGEEGKCVVWPVKGRRKRARKRKKSRAWEKEENAIKSLPISVSLDQCCFFRENSAYLPPIPGYDSDAIHAVVSQTSSYICDLSLSSLPSLSPNKPSWLSHYSAGGAWRSCLHVCGAASFRTCSSTVSVLRTLTEPLAARPTWCWRAYISLLSQPYGGTLTFILCYARSLPILEDGQPCDVLTQAFALCLRARA